MTNLLWLQGSGCSGDTISFLNSEQPNVITAFRMLNINLLWHPSLSLEMGEKTTSILNDILNCDKKLDILVVEGSVSLGPNNTGRYFMFNDRPFKDWLLELSKASEYIIAAGSCSSFGGINSANGNPNEVTGLQFLHREKGGFLGAEFLSKSKLPVINVPGCPAHPDWIMETITSILSGRLNLNDLDTYNRPKIFYSKLAHHACPLNEYYEFKASAEEFSHQGCMFENLGCKGTICESDCNLRLWLGRTGSCTRGGFPCIACTSPDFPEGQKPYFETVKLAGVPLTLPRDVPKAWYLGISGLSKAAMPKRLKNNSISFKRVD